MHRLGIAALALLVAGGTLSSCEIGTEGTFDTSTRPYFRLDDESGAYYCLPWLYLIGYSMGGSGSYALANDYYDYNGGVFAGIVRLAGQSQTALRDGIVSRTSVWMHIGLEDTEERVTATRAAFGFLEDHELNRGAARDASSYYIGGTLVDTKTLTREGREVAKESEYAGTGHGIVMLPRQDPAIMDWLYDQRAPR